MCQDIGGSERLLDDMIMKYRAGGSGVEPNSFTFNAVINTWTRINVRGVVKDPRKYWKSYYTFILHAHFEDSRLLFTWLRT